LRIDDPVSSQAYVLISAGEYERMKALLSGDPVEQMAPFLDEAFAEGWDDPALDVDNERRPT
jgi:hypothetical protein